MGHRTKISAEDGKQEIAITREFDLPLDLLFRAYIDPEIVGQWMGTKVLKLESTKHGSWQFETRDAQGDVVFRAHGVIHELVANRKITRTFEMENTPYGVQLELLEFDRLADDTSKLKMHIIYESVTQRDQVLKLGMAHGINMAHDRLQDIVNKFK